MKRMTFLTHKLLKRLALAGCIPAIVLFAIAVGRGVEPDRLEPRIRQVPPATAKTGSTQASPFRYIGVSSCSASNCHGGARRAAGPQFASYLTWWQKDTAHKGAYATLTNDNSSRIIKNLHRHRDGQPLPAHKDASCLACHAVNAAGGGGLEALAAEHTRQHSGHSVAADASRFHVGDGVQCEACHGPAEKWVALHTTAEWRDPQQWPAERKLKQTGFRDTKGLYHRARMCAECHVGGVGRDMNHDMIAAGHPRLDFEFATFHARMPSHWDVRKDQHASTHPATDAAQLDLDAQFEARAWMLGQIAAADAALELLTDRARDDGSVWPEFSEYGCFACHHDLKYKGWRTERKSAGRYPWGTWYFSMLPWIAEAPNLSGLAEALPLKDQLTRTMGKTYPNRSDTRAQAQQLRTLLRQAAIEFEKQSDGPQKLDQLWSLARSQTVEVNEHDWEYAAQLYLSLVALHYGAPDLNDADTQAEFYKTLSEIRRTLLFPANDGPRRLESPAKWREDGFGLEPWNKLGVRSRAR
jgi:hypothetical protein